MPKIVSGVSGGSIVAGFLAIHTDEEKLNSFSAGYAIPELEYWSWLTCDVCVMFDMII